MKTAFLLLIAAAAIWWFFFRPRPPLAESLYVVTADETTISVKAPDGGISSVAWKDLTKVGIRTTDEGPWQPDVFWGLHAGKEEPAVVFPGSATGEQEIIKAFNTRLPAFNDKELIRAMGSTSNSYFLLWETPR